MTRSAPFFRKVWETLDDRDTETSREDIADVTINRGVVEGKSGAVHGHASKIPAVSLT